MKFREITTEFELNLYRHITNKHIEVLLPLDYLKQGKVFACFNDQKIMCGGFAIILNAPFRVLDSVPTRTFNNYNFPLLNSAEVTGLWLSPTIRKNSESLKFWLRVLTELINSKKTIFVYAYTLSKPKLGSIYSKANPSVIYSGKTKQLSGMDQAEYESVEMVNIFNLLLGPFLHPEFFVKKFSGIRSRSLHLPQNENNKAA